MPWGEWWFRVWQDRRCRLSSFMVAGGAGMLALAFTVGVLQAQGIFLFQTGRSLDFARLAELLAVPLVMGLATGLVTWGVWRTTISQHGRQIEDQQAKLAELARDKADRNAVKESFDHLREVMELHLQNITSAAAQTAANVERLRTDYEKDRRHRDEMLSEAVRTAQKGP